MSSIPLSTLTQHLSEVSHKLGRQAYQLMEKSKDPYHDHTHVDRMLVDIQKFLKESDQAKKLNPEVAITSVLWHDTWKSGHLANNLIELLHHQWMDGLGSAELFERAAKSAKAEREFIRQVSYAIRKHAQFQFTPVKTLEASVLRDLDDLDLWSTERLKNGQDFFVFRSPWKIKLFLNTLQKQKLHTAWANAQRELRRSDLVQAVEKLLGK
jgi:hypothetical protein